MADLGLMSANGKANRVMQLEYGIKFLALDLSGSGPASVKLDGFRLAPGWRRARAAQHRRDRA